MQDFNLVPEVAGVDIRHYTGLFSRNEQRSIIDYIFGDLNPEGAIELPDFSKLFIDYRRKRGPGYKIGERLMDGKRSIALLTPSSLCFGLTLRPLLWGSNGRPKGLLTQTTSLLLGLGKYSMQEHVRGEEVRVRPDLVRTIREIDIRDSLARMIVSNAFLYAGTEEVPSEAEVARIVATTERFLGPGLADIERRTAQEPIFGWDSPPIEKLCADITVRLGGIAAE